MRIMFVGLLFSITISNVLHAMEVEAIIPSVESDDLSTNGVETLSFALKIREMKSLKDVERLSKQLFNNSQTQTKNRRSIGEADIKIPKGFTINRRVFDEYVNQERLITKFKPGWFRRTFCCSLDGENRFKHASSGFIGECFQELLMLYSPLDGQSEAKTRKISEEFIEMVNQGLESENNFFDEEQESDDDDTEERLRNAEWASRGLVKMHKLNQKLRKFLDEKLKSEDNSYKWKERTVEVVIGIAAVLGTFYSVGC